MVAELRKTNTSLYETDYNLWVLETVAKLKSRDLDGLDWDNLIEEVEDLSRRDKKKLKSLLRLLCEHLLKLTYWQSELQRNEGHWRREIRNFRKQINEELESSPSLRNYLSDIFDKCYRDGRELAADQSELPLSIFPEHPIATLEQILDEDWLP
ncbi:DUF29 domain-containing protein [Synechocystis sp. CACIAM 05]|uniref:DUF29 domain-containing protein n=1 Tax=Synechocystis sp. CACIAM 05 TaxID=1933929 RepID=UPI00138E6DBA|nr:DUF29 domain-containing protein [Synechocystis sp. CACIAM 05]QHV01741.1 hypothetical protein BWK47_06175 [Synechocystis sp. CACIAM 05]